MARSHFWSALLLLSLTPTLQPAFAKPPAATAPTSAIDEKAERQRIEEASTLIGQGRPEKAIARLDTLIEARSKAHAAETRLVFNSRSPSEALYYMAQAAAAKRDAVVFNDGWSLAIFLKGFALIDLGRNAEAKAMYDRALELSPMNSHYLGELAEWHKSRKDWSAAYAAFERALQAGDFSPDGMKVFDKTRALRGLGFVLIEQGKLDEAEARFRESLKLDPGDAKAKGELRYIEEQRSAAGKNAA